MEERQRQGRTSQRAGQENSQRKERTEGNWKAIRAHWDGGEQFNLESHAEPLPGSFPERQGKEHSKELCTLRMPRAGQTTHTEIHIYICEYVSRRLMAREEKQKRHSKGLEGKNRTLKTSKREGKRKTQ